MLVVLPGTNKSATAEELVEYVLDLYSGAIEGFSVAQLSSDDNNAFTLRRSSGSPAEQTFKASEIEAGDDATWAGAADGFVKDWIGQVAGSTLSQTDTDKQPQTISAGSKIQLSSRDVLDLDGSNDSLQGTLPAQENQPFTIFLVVKLDVADGYVLDGSDSTDRVIIGEHDGSNDWHAWAGSNLLSGINCDLVHRLITVIVDGSNSEFYLNGKLEASGDVGSRSLSGLTVGAHNAQGAQFIDGQVQEILIFDGALEDLKRVGIEANRRDYFSVWTPPAWSKSSGGGDWTKSGSGEAWTRHYV